MAWFRNAAVHFLDCSCTTTCTSTGAEFGHPNSGTYRWMVGGEVFQIAPFVKILEVIVVGRLRANLGVLHDQLPIDHNRPFKESSVPFLEEGEVECNMSLPDSVIVVKAFERFVKMCDVVYFFHFLVFWFIENQSRI